MTMPECCMKPAKSSAPPACCMKKRNEPTDSWEPDAESSLLEDEPSPDRSSFCDSEDESSKRKRDYTECSDISPITSESNVELSKNICNKVATSQKAQAKEKDLTMIYSPFPPPRGSYGHSKSFAQSDLSHTKTSRGYYGKTFDESRDYTDLGPWKNFDIPSNIQPKFVQAGAHKSFPRTHVPRPSRNYSTYDDNQRIMNVKEVAEYRKQQPRYFSTPKSPSAVPWQGADESSVWGQDLSSFDPTDSTTWSSGVRMGAFDVIKHMTPSPKNMDTPPRRIQPYAADQRRVNTFPPKVYSSQPPLTGPQYPYMDQTFTAGSDMGHRFVTGTQQRGEKFMKRPANANLTKTRQLQSSSFSGQPAPGRLQSTFVQRPQSAQGYTTFNRPKISQDIYSSRLNATMEGYARRPQTANAIMEGYQPHPLHHPNALGQPQFHGEGSKPAIRVPQSAGMGSTNRFCSTACKSNQLTQSRQAVPIRQELAPLNEFHNLNQNYETLLEIRTPRIQGGNQSNYPFQISINVTCAERSLLVTPQKRYTMLEKNSVYPEASKNNTSCCRCP